MRIAPRVGQVLRLYDPADPSLYAEVLVAAVGFDGVNYSVHIVGCGSGDPKGKKVFGQNVGPFIVTPSDPWPPARDATYRYHLLVP